MKVIRPARKNRVGLRLLGAVAMLSALILAVSAQADSATERKAYVDRLEAICKPGVEKTQRAVKGVKSDVQAERLAVAAAKLAKAAHIFNGTVGRISAVPRPAKDAAQFAKWFSYLRLQESYLARAGAALRAERIPSYQHSIVRFAQNGNKANDVVIAYGFNYCLFNFRRFN
jgi:hypothetical protein